MTDVDTVENTDAPEVDAADVDSVEATDAEAYETETPEVYTSESEESTKTPSGRPGQIAPGAAVGRRKEAVARVRITPGSGEWKINGRALDDYFPNKVHQQIVKEPFVAVGADDKYDVVATIDGGGISGQAGALRLGIARSLNGIDEEANRPSLKKAGYLTRDPRAKERKKYGLKKARKASQYSKR